MFLNYNQMTLKSTFLILALTAGLTAHADSPVITLDLTKATTPLTFNADNGSWTGTFDDDAAAIESQCFSFVHNAMQSWSTWWGFTASNSHDNAYQANALDYQWSNMAEGGIELNADGTVKLDDFGAPVVNPAVPYLVAYYSSFMSARPLSSAFNTGKNYEPVGVYVNLNSYTYYPVEEGNSFARAFTNGDKLTLTFHGVAPSGEEKIVEVSLASYSNGDLTIARGWKYVDLTALGTVNEIYYTMTSTDEGTYGANTPLYFCMDKLMVKEATEASATAIDALAATITYDRANRIVNIANADFARIFDTTGAMVMAGEQSAFDISDLPAGIYVVKAGNSVLKIAK